MEPSDVVRRAEFMARELDHTLTRAYPSAMLHIAQVVQATRRLDGYLSLVKRRRW